MHKHTVVLALLLAMPAMAAARQPAAQKPTAQKPTEEKAAEQKPATKEPAPEQPAGPAVLVAGAVSSAARQVDNDTNSSKLTEYRDLSDRPFVPRLTLAAVDTRNGWFAEFSGANVSLRDQTLFARGGVAGVWRAGVEWSELPHNFSNKAQTPYFQRAPGLLEVPAHVPITFKRLGTAAADTAGVLASDQLIAAYQRSFLHPTPLETETSSRTFALDYAGWEALRVGAAYDQRKQSGAEWTFAPIGDRPPRTLNIQIAEPVDSKTQELTLTADRVTTNYALQVNYLFSDYANAVDTLVWENIYTTAAPDATYDLWDRAVSTYGRRPLEPDNRYHNVSVTLGRDLPRDSRLNATVAYGRLEQNQTLLPYSYGVEGLANRALPRSTAEANIDTLQLLVDYVVNPVARLNVRAWAHRFGLDNNTPEERWQYVTSDTTNLNGGVAYVNKRINTPYANDRTNVGTEVSYRLRPWRSSIGARYEHEATSRTHREADTSDNRVGFTYHARPWKGVNLRGRYLFGVRGGTYDPFVTRESYWYLPSEVAGDANDPRVTFDNHPDMRRFDVSDRRRHQADLTLTIVPGEVFSLSGTVRYRSDDFDSDVAAIQPLAGTAFADAAAFTPGTQLGLLEDRRTRYSFDAFCQPVPRLSLNAFVAIDDGTNLQRGLEFNENNKQNPSAVQTAELGPWTRASSQWMADTDDRVFTTGAGTFVTIVPDRLLLNLSYTLSVGNVDISYSGYGVTNWDGTPFPPNHQFAFSSPPRVNQDWHVLDLRAEVPLFKQTVFTFGYTYERYRTDDWQQAPSLAWVEPVGSEFLLRDTSRSFQWGNRLFNLGSFLAPSYDAHFTYAAFTYRF
jgi:MtrB/PioB family decaheme-associated outer membrane protein